jgi:uncharacterized protein YciI
MAMRLFAVTLYHGPAWDSSQPLEAQKGWVEHASFMDALVAEGFVVLGGPLEGASGALLIIRARSADEIHTQLAADPWFRLDLLRVVSIVPWILRLGSL